MTDDWEEHPVSADGRAGFEVGPSSGVVPPGSVALDPSIVYQSLSARRIAFDQMMWQVPALSLTAQAFLISVGVTLGLPLAVRALALALAALSGALSLQLMAKQRFHEQVDTAYLRHWEDAAGVRPVYDFLPHDHAHQTMNTQGRSKAEALGLPPGKWVRLSSYRFWMWGLRLFVFSALALLVWLVWQSLT